MTNNNHPEYILVHVPTVAGGDREYQIFEKCWGDSIIYEPTKLTSRTAGLIETACQALNERSARLKKEMRAAELARKARMNAKKKQPPVKGKQNG